MEISLFIPCFIDQVCPETGMHMVKILELLGCKVNYNTDQTCCGQPAYNSGFQKEAQKIAQKFIKDFEGTAPIVGPSGSCAGYVRNFYEKMPYESEAEIKSCASTSTRIHEFAEFVVKHLDYHKLSLKKSAKITYHDGCGSLRECKIKDAPRTLLQIVEGTELIEMKECETCCGFGGTFAVKFEPISTGMAYTKIHSAIDTGAEYIVSSDYSCLMHLNAYIEKNNLPIKTMHIVDYLYESLQ